MHARSATRDSGCGTIFVAGQKNCYGSFLRRTRRRGENGLLFSCSRLAQKNMTHIRTHLCEKKEASFPIRRGRPHKLPHFAIRRRVLLFFRRFLLFTVTENKLKGVFRYSQELFIGKHVLVLAVG